MLCRHPRHPSGTEAARRSHLARHPKGQSERQSPSLACGHWGCLDCNAGATKTFILEARRKNSTDPHWALCFGMRPGKELYDLRQDPDCLHNRAAHPESAARRAALQDALFAKLKQEGDPRVFGQGDVFSQYPHASPGHVNFHGRFLHGELVQHVLAMAGREACVTGQVRRPALPETSIRT